MATRGRVANMDSALLAMDSIYGVAFLAAGVLAALQSKHDLRYAKNLVIVGALIMAARWSIWAFTTDAHWLLRGAVGALIGATLFIFVPAAMHWISERHTLLPTAEQEGAQPSSTTSGPPTEVPSLAGLAELGWSLQHQPSGIQL